MTIFSKIIAGELPSYKIFEDDLTYAFLDINPVNLGHTLIIPKIEVDEIWDLKEPFYSRVFLNSKFIAEAIKKATNCLRVCSWVEGFAVPHAHFHICPIYKEKGEFWFKTGQRASNEELKSIQEKILNFIN